MEYHRQILSLYLQSNWYFILLAMSALHSSANHAGNATTINY